MQPVSRRSALSLLAASTALAAAGAAGAAESLFFQSRKLPIGIQLYTLGDLITSDLDNTLKQLSAIGYHDVESAGFGGRTPAEFKRALDAANLQCISAHIPAKSPDPKVLSLTSPKAELADAIKTIGLEVVVLPILIVPDRFGPRKPGGDYMENVVKNLTADDWKRTADFLNEKGKELADTGAQFGYHSHNPEYYPVGGTTGLDILMQNTDPKLVQFEIDTGWVAAGGHDPVQILTKYAGRVRMIHIKDLKADTETNYWLKIDSTEIGSGKQDWAKILPAAYKLGVRHFFVEQEPPYPLGRLKSAELNYRYLSTLKTA